MGTEFQFGEMKRLWRRGAAAARAELVSPMKKSLLSGGERLAGLVSVRLDGLQLAPGQARGGAEPVALSPSCQTSSGATKTPE